MSDDDQQEYEEYEEESVEAPAEELDEESTTSSWDMPTEDALGYDNFDFAEAYSDDPSPDEKMLPENSAPSAIKCAFLGLGGGGGKMAKAFLDLGFHKTLLINTTEKDQPPGIDPENFLLIPGADGVGKDIQLGKQVLGDNSALVEDALRTRIGKVDWLFVLVGGGGGTGSASYELHKCLTRYLSSIEATGRVIYIISKPSAQELLNPTIKANSNKALQDVKKEPHIVIDNEKQLHLLRGKVGMLNMYPAANLNFAKLFAQILKLATEASPIQAFDSKDLEKCLYAPGRILLGSTVVRNPRISDLGATVLQGCLNSSPCSKPSRHPKMGVLLLVTTPEMANDPIISNQLEAAFSYVGGRAETLFSGVYIKEPLPGLVAMTLLGGM
jgi:cell division GTPase FtsZ